MVSTVTLDAMIPRADFAVAGEEVSMENFDRFPISYITSGNPVLLLLRKPDFQRETNHWSAEQIATFIASFLDGELIPSLILWKSEKHIFIIDGGHRLSALRAWIEDDYGDGPLSRGFYNGDISENQKRMARRTRMLVEQKLGRFSTLQSIVANQAPGDELQVRRAGRLFTRSLTVQWVHGDHTVAETSFFKINSQGTPLDDTEELLLRNRRKAFSIAARAIVRAGTGNKYWSSFPGEVQRQIEQNAEDLYRLLFKPEVNQPLKTLDVPLGGTASPVDALSLLIDYLMITSAGQVGSKPIAEYGDDSDGNETLRVLKTALSISNRITSDKPGSLGLHPAVYFYNEKGKHSRFLFLGMFSLVAERIKNNNDDFFKKFTIARARLETFLVENKSLIGILLQNTNRTARVTRVKELLSYLVEEFSSGKEVTIENAISRVGVRGKFYDITNAPTTHKFSEDTKSAIFVRKAIEAALKCPICEGALDPAKSVSYDHITPKRLGGMGEAENGQMVHPFCNTGIKG